MRAVFYSSTAVIALALAGPALAQQAPAAAATVDANDTAEIIVTAQKRPEKLQEIPVAAAVLSAASVAQQHVTDLSDINRVVPSVEIKGTFNGRVPYGMRGISTNANEGAIGLTSGVSIQVDGVPVPADSFAANTVSDVSQLEVLKGPQATLGGRTASAGVINFVTYAPTRTTHFGFSALATDDGQYRMDVHVSAPINDVLSYSLAGYDSRTPYPVHNINLGINSRADSYGIRGKLKLDTGNFDATVMGHYALSTSQGENFVPKYFTPGASVFPFIPSAFGPFGPTAYGISQAVAFPGYTIGYGNTVYSSPVVMTSRYEDQDGSVNLNYHLGGVTLSSLTAIFRENQYQNQDIFETNVYFFDVLTGGQAPHFDNTQTDQGYVDQFTQEFKLATDPTRPVNFLGGAFYSNTKVVGNGYNSWVGNPLSRANISSTKTYSVYGRVTAKLSDMFAVVGGIRYNHDKIGWNDSEIFNPAGGRFYNCNPNTNANNIPQSCQYIVSDSSNTMVGDVAVQFHPSKDVLVYGSYTRGYKPRAFNTAHDFHSYQTGPILLPHTDGTPLTPAEVAVANGAFAADSTFAKPTDKERIDSFELGLKSSLLDHHMTFNLAAFYTKYNGYQAQLFDTTQVVGVLVLANAGARSEGVEADLNYNRGNTRMSMAAAYIDAKFLSFAGATCYPTQSAAQGCVGGAQNLTGQPLPDSPKFKFNASLTQTVPLDALNLVLGSNLSYRSAALLQADQNPQTAQPAFALVDLSLGFQTKDEKATLTFFVNNLTNHFYYTNMEDFFSGAIGTAAIPSGAVTPGNYVIGQPARDSHRYFGGRLAVTF